MSSAIISRLHTGDGEPLFLVEAPDLVRQPGHHSARRGVPEQLPQQRAGKGPPHQRLQGVLVRQAAQSFGYEGLGGEGAGRLAPRSATRGWA